MPSRLSTLLAAGLLGLPLAVIALAEEKGPPNTLTEAEAKEGWKLLFDGKSLDAWRRFKKQDTAGWSVKDGAIYLDKPGSGDLMTRDKFANFEFSVDFKFESGNNSGIIYRCTEEGGTTYTSGPEMQVANHKPTDKLGKNSGGALYDMYAPSRNPYTGSDWVTFKIVCKGPHIEHWVNGVKVVDCDIGSPDWNEKLASSKWKNNKLFAAAPAGHIALQDHGGKVLFRNVKIRVLPDK